MSESESGSSRSPREGRRKRHWSYRVFVVVFVGVLGWWLRGVILEQIHAPVESTRSDAEQFAWAVHEVVRQRGDEATEEDALAVITPLIAGRQASEYSRLDQGVPVDHWGSSYRIAWKRDAAGLVTVTCTSPGPDRTKGTADDIVGRAATGG